MNPLFPQPADNNYRGSRIALGLFVVLLLLKILMSVNCIFNGYEVATNADGVPLETFSPAAVRIIMYDFAAWGLAHLVIAAIGTVVLLRYRSLVPLMFALLLLELLSRKAVAQFLPIAKRGTPPGFFVNVVLITLMAAGLVLSLWSPRRLRLQESV